MRLPRDPNAGSAWRLVESVLKPARVEAGRTLTRAKNRQKRRWKKWRRSEWGREARVVLGSAVAITIGLWVKRLLAQALGADVVAADIVRGASRGIIDSVEQAVLRE